MMPLGAGFPALRGTIKGNKTNRVECNNLQQGGCQWKKQPSSPLGFLFNLIALGLMRREAPAFKLGIALMNHPGQQPAIARRAPVAPFPIRDPIKLWTPSSRTLTFQFNHSLSARGKFAFLKPYPSLLLIIP
jgi:hypothetical protein